jgi:siroheme synthase (precorrin-2 oxidase/ferrochelatase)
LGKRVLVVGGGDVAMDAARTALRLGRLTEDMKESLSQTEARADEESDAVHAALDVARTALRLGERREMIPLNLGKNYRRRNSRSKRH